MELPAGEVARRLDSVDDRLPAGDVRRLINEANNCGVQQVIQPATHDAPYLGRGPRELAPLATPPLCPSARQEPTVLRHDFSLGHVTIKDLIDLEGSLGSPAMVFREIVWGPKQAGEYYQVCVHARLDLSY